MVATVRQPATALFFVAQASGCLAREGVEVEERPFELGRDALALLRRGDADVAVAYHSPLVRAAFSDARLRALTTLHTSTRNTRVVARRASGVATFSDLAGKRVGAAPGTNAGPYLALALQLGGVAPERVAVEDLAPQLSVAALERGALDAAVLSDPFAGEAERRLGGAAVVLQTDLYAEASLVVTRDDVLARDPVALAALLRGLACAEREAHADPEGARARIRARFPEQDDAALRAQLDRVSWRLGIDHVLLDVLRRERDTLVASGDVAGTPPDPWTLVAPRLLDEVAPDALMLLTRQDGTPW